MSDARRIAWLVAAWAVFLGVYAGVSFYLRQGPSLSSFGDIVQCFVPLIANAGLLINAGTPHWRRNIFWMLLALSCSMWMFGQFQWTYYEVYLHKQVPALFAGDIIFFLRGIPVIAALALRPHRKRGELRVGLGYLDFALLLSWWAFLYIYSVLPWMYASPSVKNYNFNYYILANTTHALIVGGFTLLCLLSRGPWRTIYAHLLGASALYMTSSLAINLANDPGHYYTGSLYDLPLMTTFFWFAMAGVIAYQRRTEMDAATESNFQSDTDQPQGESIWAARLAMAAVLSLPLFALYALRVEHDTPAVREFRLTVTVVAAL